MLSSPTASPAEQVYRTPVGNLTLNTQIGSSHVSVKLE